MSTNGNRQTKKLPQALANVVNKWHFQTLTNKPTSEIFSLETLMKKLFFFFFRVLENLSQFFKWLLNWREREQVSVRVCASMGVCVCVRACACMGVCVCVQVCMREIKGETECGKKSPKKTLAIRDPDISAYDLN